jgi:hypothetical protein
MIDSLWFRVALINVEFVLAAWVLSRWHLRTARLVLNGVFAIFGVYAIALALGGRRSCGCFGVVEINPWITGSFDLLLATILYWSRSAVRKTFPPGLRLMVVGSCLVLAITCCIAVAANSTKQTQTVSSEKLLIDASRKLVVLEPDSWKGSTFPLAAFINEGTQLMNGDWVVVLYHADCSDCQKAIPAYERMAEANSGKSAIHLAFIALSERDREAGRSLFHSIIPMHGQLASSHHWFTATPVTLHISDGKVTNTAVGEAALDPLWLNRRQNVAGDVPPRVN